MTSMTHPARYLTVGVDTHQDVHLAVAIDQLGARVDQISIPTTAVGYRQLEQWASSLGLISKFGVEGTASYGAELTRRLRGSGHTVIEVNRPDRGTRHRLGKSDPIDAEMAARAVLSGVATVVPKKIAKDSAVKARTQSLQQIKSILVTAPAELRESFTGMTTLKLLRACAAMTPDLPTTKDILRLATQAAPQLLSVLGVGPDAAATLLITIGDNLDRLHSEAAFAALCGVSPVPASSGKTSRHRLNRGGDRQSNATLYRIALIRMRHHEPTKKYLAKRMSEGKTKAETMRCLKRFIAREIFNVLCRPAATRHQEDLAIQP